MKTYAVNVYREDGWWMVAIPEIDGLTQARSLREAEHMARDYIAVWSDVPADSFDVAVTVSKVGQLVDVSYLAANITRRRAQVAELERETSAQAAKLAKTLAAEHVTVRDIGQVLGVSYQRAQQLVAA